MNHLDLPNCQIPTPLPENPTKQEKLEHIGSIRTYRLCQIQSAQKHMEFLASELAQDSVEAGILTRNIVRNFREIEMAFLTDIRRRLSLLISEAEK